MGYNEGYVPLSRVVENVYRNAGFDFVDWESAIEWTASLVGIIGVPTSYINKSTNGQNDNPPFIEINDFKGILPNDIIVRGVCRRVELDETMTPIKMAPMVESPDLFFTTDSSAQQTNLVFFEPYFKTVYIDEDGETQVVTLQQSTNYSYNNGLEAFNYKIEGNVIFTDFEIGYVEMSYKGFMTDENGLPMIPDDEKYIRAVVNEIIYRLDYLNWRKNPSPQNASIKNDSAQQRDWAVASAITKGRIPSIDEMESIKKAWLRTIPKTEEHGTNFRTLNKEERRYTYNTMTWRGRRY